MIAPALEQDPHLRVMRCTRMIFGITRDFTTQMSTRRFSLAVGVSDPFVGHFIGLRFRQSDRRSWTALRTSPLARDDRALREAASEGNIHGAGGIRLAGFERAVGVDRLDGNPIDLGNRLVDLAPFVAHERFGQCPCTDSPFRHEAPNHQFNGLKLQPYRQALRL